MKTTDQFHDQVVISPEEYYEGSKADGFRSHRKCTYKKLESSNVAVRKGKPNNRVARRKKG